LRVLAVDGSTLRLDSVSPDCREYFHPLATRQPGACALARTSQCFDVLNHICVDAVIDRHEVGERVLAMSHLNVFTAHDVVLFDRGYPAFWLMAQLQHHGTHFCMRIPTGSWTAELKDFAASKEAEQLLVIEPNAEQKNLCRDLGLPCEPIAVRAIRVTLNTGEIEVLFTNLLDTERWPTEAFKELYHSRWGVESEFRRWKSPLEIERWSGKSVAVVEQDFHACVLLSNLGQIFAHEADAQVREKTKGRKHEYRVNRVRALGIMAGTIWKLIYTLTLEPLIQSVLTLMEGKPSPIRRGRKYPRNFRLGPRRFSQPYKALS
jgi:hypothetical protein